MTNQTPAPVSLEEAVARLIALAPLPWRTEPDEPGSLDILHGPGDGEDDPATGEMSEWGYVAEYIKPPELAQAIVDLVNALPHPAPEPRADAGGEVERLRGELEAEAARLEAYADSSNASDFEASHAEGKADGIRFALNYLPAPVEATDRDPRFIWCQPVVQGCPQERVWMVRYEDQDQPDISFTGPDAEAEARAFWHKANVAWNCYLFASAPQHPAAEEILGFSSIGLGKPAPVEAKLGNTPVGEVLRMSADMLDEAAQRLGGLTDMPVNAAKLRTLADRLAAPVEAEHSSLPPTQLAATDADRLAFELWAESDNRNVQPLQDEERYPENWLYYDEDSTNEAYVGWCARGSVGQGALNSVGGSDQKDLPSDPQRAGEGVESVVDALLKTGDFPVYVTTEDAGLERDEYIDFANRILSALAPGGQADGVDAALVRERSAVQFGSTIVFTGKYLAALRRLVNPPPAKAPGPGEDGGA